ncbi:MAG: L-threonylcarbamoyladenylate synthase [Gemmatimonadota bacterium]
MNGATHPILPMASGEDRARSLGQVVVHLREGGLVVYPTETVYGVGGLLLPAALEALAVVKDRSDDSPFLLLIPSTDVVEGLIWSPAAMALADHFWPGPMTLILPDPVGTFPGGVRSLDGGVAVRISPNPIVRDLLTELDMPLTSTSANRRGRPPVRSPREVDLPLPPFGLEERLQGASGLIPILDGGDLPPSPPSTLVDCTGEYPVVLREGGVSTHELRQVIPETSRHV